MKKFRTGKVAYITEGKLSAFDMGCPSGSALVCASRAYRGNIRIGDTAIVCLEDGMLFYCNILAGSSPSTYDLEVCEELVMKDAAVRWSEPILQTLLPGTLEDVRRGDPDAYYRNVVSHPLPVLSISEGGRAILTEPLLMS